MRTVGIIAEYNPFHTGHEYHLKKAKERSGADFAVVVMSPDFVQRGEPAIFDKYARTQMALLGGADLVLELPVCYAAGSAEYFAQGAVGLLDALGVVDELCFGAEVDDARLFTEVARVLWEEPEAYQAELKRLLREGNTFPAARSQALISYLSSPGPSSRPVYMHADAAHSDSGTRSENFAVTAFLQTPNNILGIEYCRALAQLHSPIRPLPLKRNGSCYNSTALEGAYCSATALRNNITGACNEERLLPYIPAACREAFLSIYKEPVTAEAFLPVLTGKLLSMDTFDHILDISPDLSDRIRALRYDCIGRSWEEIVALLKTKQLTEARIRRALLHLILDIRTDAVEGFRTNGMVFYARALGFRREAAPLLRAIKENSRIPLLTKNARALDGLDETGALMWNQGLFASHLYRAFQKNTFSGKSGRFRTEYEISPVIL
jgi:predicted nucleotidyltransferase